MKTLLAILVSLVLTAGTALAGDGPFQVRFVSGVTQPFDTSTGVTRGPAVSEGTACVWISTTADDIYFTLDGSKPVATAGAGGNGTVLEENKSIAFLPDEAKRFRFCGAKSSAGWVTYRQYNGWIAPW